ncbi:hypothetical protein CDL15_Pgr017175 [Punica granatum]|uniref:Uncharacterized protein n=1 Tax=Punica granatum TaxID=22663 RepID=A0A218VZP0_PUNGR|nr:hypothetical protein CDL15_Pgr017175 [Punica granatum]
MSFPTSCEARRAAPPNPGRKPWLRLLKKIAAFDNLVLQFEAILKNTGGVDIRV